MAHSIISRIGRHNLVLFDKTTAIGRHCHVSSVWWWQQDHYHNHRDIASAMDGTLPSCDSLILVRRRKTSWACFLFLLNFVGNHCKTESTRLGRLFCSHPCLSDLHYDWLCQNHNRRVMSRPRNNGQLIPLPFLVPPNVRLAWFLLHSPGPRPCYQIVASSQLLVCIWINPKSFCS